MSGNINEQLRNYQDNLTDLLDPRQGRDTNAAKENDHNLALAVLNEHYLLRSDQRLILILQLPEAAQSRDDFIPSNFYVQLIQRAGRDFFNKLFEAIQSQDKLLASPIYTTRFPLQAALAIPANVLHFANLPGEQRIYLKAVEHRTTFLELYPSGKSTDMKLFIHPSLIHRIEVEKLAHVPQLPQSIFVRT